MDQREYWDKASKEKEFTTPFDEDLFGRFVKKDAAILDFGCGYGRISKTLLKSGYLKILGTDFSKEMIERASIENPEINFLHYPSIPLPFKDESFDAVVITAVLTCIIDDNEIEALICEINRVLIEGGYIYINDFLLNYDKRNLDRYEIKKDLHPYGVFELEEGALLRHFEKKKMEEFLSSFITISFNEVVYTTMNGNKSNGFNYLGRKNF